ncbi:TonB-dependent receptor plug domain-containing protein [Maribacter halichondriae]|uniref:TonB-dependent receptor plug domain-containing protein n=1 Tax=Maribacter halichondriae TaxID=2980554 RepID=UPI002359E86A|nr:TonB-dependent receptor plug domain-containing protein [Maribacter sp. Hal144]
MYQLIGAEVPGAQVSGTTIRLRGNAINSVNSGQEPLLIVDGTVVGSLEYILPREVASVRVIRDENASIYGARGANGVIVIKMKN